MPAAVYRRLYGPARYWLWFIALLGVAVAGLAAMAGEPMLGIMLGLVTPAALLVVLRTTRRKPTGGR